MKLSKNTKNSWRKRSCAALLCAVLLLLCACSAGAPQADALPQVGDEIGGFVVQSVTQEEVLGATSILFEHTQSGAQLLWLACEDTNRSFDITFRTPALDDTGKAHVFEHMTICGSEKYPDPNMFFPFANQTYSTFVNALTYHGMTSYPLSSLSEDQLMTMMDYYLSAVFHPLVYSEPRMVQREAWRYELSDPQSPITLAGTVYSEMQGAGTITSAAANNNLRAAFADGLTAHESGGTVEAIPTLTKEALTQFHDTYYQPANALIVLYGDLDIQRFLTAIDTNWLSQYEKTDVAVEMGRVEPYTETRYATYDFPVEAGAPTQNASCLYYSFVAQDATLEDYFQLTLLAAVLSQESSPVMTALRAALPQAGINIYADVDLPTPTFSFVASGVNEADRDTFVSAVDEGLAQLGTQGFSQEELDAVLAVVKRSLLLTGEDQDLAVNASLQIALGWTYFDRTDLYTVYENAVGDASTATMRDTLNRYLTGNRYRAVSVTRPVPGLAEENAAALEKTLADLKAGMTDEEINAMVQATDAFTQWSAAASDPEVIAPILNVTPESLPEELVHYDVRDESKDGVRFVTSETPVAGIAMVSMRLDGGTLPIEQLQDVETYLGLLGQLPTAQHSREELDRLSTRYMDNFGATLIATNNFAEAAQPVYDARISYRVLSEDVTPATDLLSEMLESTDLTDTTTIRQLLSRERTGFAQNLDANVLNMQMLRLLAALYPSYAYLTYISGFDYDAHLEELLALDDAALTKRLTDARELVLNRRGAVVTCAGDADTIADVCGKLGGLLATFPDTERAAVDYAALCKDIGWEAVTCNSTVQMNLVMDATSSFNGRNAVVSALVDDMYLLPQLRNAYGAYGAYSFFGQFYNMLYTYRDPNLGQTFDVFEALPEYLRTADITQDMVDSYIVGCYTSQARPEGVMSGAVSAIDSVFNGMTEAVRLQWMQETKQATVADVRAAADTVEQLVANGVRSTSATASTIEKNRELFTSVVGLTDSGK